MEWISVKDEEPDLNKVHFLLSGDSVYLRGTILQPFFVQISGEIKTMGNIDFTHWMPVPKPLNGLNRKVCLQCNLEKELKDFPVLQGRRSSPCKACKYNSVKKWRQKNIEKVRLYNKEYNKSNSEKIRARQAVYRERRKNGWLFVI